MYSTTDQFQNTDHGFFLGNTHAGSFILHP